MHVVSKPKLTKRLNEHVRKTMEEMMITTTAFIRGEVAASKKKRHTSWKARDYDNIADLFYRQNYMAAGTTKAPSDHRRHQSFHKSMVEFHDYKVIVTLQREERTRPANFKVALHPDFPDQEVAIGGTLSDKGRTELCSILKKNLDIFAWQPSDKTGVPRLVAKHRLNIREGYSPVRQKKKGQALERANALQAEVQKLVEVGIMREVYYHDWLSNLVMVKKHDGS
nr:reverse transcriptase domain-containing protein [Tanacetum cinerariifolium]